MNILFLALDINLENKAGDSVHVRELTTSLAKLGNEVVLIVADIPDKSPSQKWASATPNIHLYFKMIKPGFRSFRTLLYCRKVAKKHKIQVIYERRTTPKIGYTLGRIIGVPAIIEVNGLPGEEAEMLRGLQKKKFAWPIRRKISHHIFRSIDAIVTVTKGIKKEIVRDMKVRTEKVFVIQNGANTNLFKPLDRDRCRDKLGLIKNERYVCFVGNLAPWQGLEFLVKASPYITDEVNNINFLIAGDGVMAESLKEMANDLGMKERFNFLGMVPYEDIPQLINASDVCVAPFIRARNEKIGLSPLKLYEYLACEKPVVASDIVGVGDFLRENGCGIAVEPENHKSLAEGVIQLLKDDKMSIEMGRNGRDIVTKEYSWDGVAKKVMKVCEYVS